MSCVGKVAKLIRALKIGHASEAECIPNKNVIKINKIDADVQVGGWYILADICVLHMEYWYCYCRYISMC